MKHSSCDVTHQNFLSLVEVVVEVAAVELIPTKQESLI